MLQPTRGESGSSNRALSKLPKSSSLRLSQSDLGHLEGRPCTVQARVSHDVNGKVSMSAATGTDWTRILSDPDLVRHVGKLLQAYREAPPDKRAETLLAAMREIKAGAAGSVQSHVSSAAASTPHPVPTPTSSTPPFEPDLFSPNWGSGRRRHHR